MRYAIIGDFHGADLGGLEKALDSENVDSLVCLGDFDKTKTIHQFMQLEQKYQDQGKEVIKVPGNHDLAVLFNIPITSGTLESQGKDIYQLHQELMDDDEALKYLSELVRSSSLTNHRKRLQMDSHEYNDFLKTIITHGGYDGDFSSYPDCPAQTKNLWVRLRTEEDHQKNFAKMDKKGHNIMIRGHDHKPEYTYRDPKKGIVTYNPEETSDYRLFLYRKHTINPGPAFQGRYTIIDTNVSGETTPIAKYRKTK